jgi:hypothetical protein
VVDRRASRVEDGRVDPGVVGAEAGRPDDRFDLELAAALERDGALVRVDGAVDELDAVVAFERSEARAD